MQEFNLYVRRNTWLHRLDPRVKLLLVLEFSLFVFLWPALWSAGLIVLLSMLLLWQAQVRRIQVWGVWRAVLPVMALVFVLTALFGGDGVAPWFRIGPLTVTAGSVREGAVLALRLLALALIVFLWLATTEQAAMVRGFVSLGMPYEWGLTLSLALRYLPIFAGLFVQVREAQQARGLDLDQQRFWSRLAAYRPVLVAMIISALRQSEHLGWALEVRALGAQGVRRTVYHPLRLRRGDVGVLVLLILAGVLVALLYLLS